MTMLVAALDLAAHGLPVFPCRPCDKVPAISRGFYAATTNPETIKRYWLAADRNIGIPTGTSSGFWVLDIDGDEGAASLRALEAEHGVLPPTRAVITGGGGRHLWWRYTGPIANSTGLVAPGIDVRGDGGYVVAPPSIHRSGRSYAWTTDSAEALAEAPRWLVNLTRKRPTISQLAIANRPAASVQHSGYGRAALEYEIAALAGTPPGERNHQLNRAAFSLFQLVAGGELNSGEVEHRLVDACHRNGLVGDDGLRSVIATIRSGRRAGLQHPRIRSGAA
jgi:hypothetical protein